LQIGTGEVTSDEIGDGGVAGVDIANGTISGSDIAGSTISGGHIANSSLTGSDIQNDSLTSSDIVSIGIDVYSCRWTGWVNGYDGVINDVCGGDEVMTGMYSVHNNDREDRVFKFHCCNLRLH
jgi:hypothetical protein